MVIYINDLKLKLEYSFLLIIAFAYLSTNRQIIHLIIFSSVHEAMHLLTLYIFRGKASEITIAYYGIGLKYSYNFGLCREIVFLLSGAAANLLLYACGIDKEINISLALVNLLPIYPLDGGRALKLLLNKFTALYISDKIFKCLSVITVLIMIIYSVEQRNISFFMITIYVTAYALNNSYA